MSKRGAGSVLVAAFALLALVFAVQPSMAHAHGGRHFGGVRIGAHMGGRHFGGVRSGGRMGGRHFTAGAPVFHGGFASPRRFPASRGRVGHFGRGLNAIPHAGRHGFVGHSGVTRRPGFTAHPGVFERPGFSAGAIVGQEHDRGNFDGGFRDHDNFRDHDRGDRHHHDRDHDHDRHRRWHGGYWHGLYWPPMFWGADLAWFLPTLPAYAPVYWWDGVPYYYYDNGYYIWEPNQDGYVATAPPPVVDDSTASPSPDSQQPPQDSELLYAYPENGQSAEQQSADRQACEQWAHSQTDTDVGDTAAASGAADAGNVDGRESTTIDYRRALAACLTGRGYSVD